MEKSKQEIALHQAKEFLKRDHDPYFLASTLVELHEQNTKMDALIRDVRRFMASGQDAQSHTKIIVALQSFASKLEPKATTTHLGLSLEPKYEEYRPDQRSLRTPKKDLFL